MIKFYVHAPVGLDQLAFEEEARRAVVEATALGYLRQNSVDSLTGKNSGNNLGPGTPLFHFRQWREPHVEVKLMLKVAGCENVGAQYALPTELKEFEEARQSRPRRREARYPARALAGPGQGVRARLPRRLHRRRSCFGTRGGQGTVAAHRR